MKLETPEKCCELAIKKGNASIYVSVYMCIYVSIYV
jgi:hypothetical protein